MYQKEIRPEIKISIVFTICLLIAIGLFSLLQIFYSEAISKISVLTDDHKDIDNWFALLLELIISPMVAVYLSIIIYRKQKRDDERKQQKSELTDLVTRLNDIISPLIENTAKTKDNFDLFKRKSGPYLLEIFERKDLYLKNMENLVQRYNLSSPAPSEEFITLVERMIEDARKYPKTVFTQFSTNTVTITDCSKCDAIYEQSNLLLEHLEKERSRLEDSIRVYDKNI